LFLELTFTSLPKASSTTPGLLAVSRLQCADAHRCPALAYSPRIEKMVTLRGGHFSFATSSSAATTFGNIRRWLRRRQHPLS
jgi:hypothetical protein